ncbi:dihydroxyacetone kinase subunit L [Citrobacter freundii]|uniref:dihydroxyacetone kinase subunit DhaL n=1 Tax=Citrobacter freundii TaxID=546 RepID=UPI0014959F2E|nr:dihydroxyacetone kinase subunit DhaL [Citrobacter freundii]EJD6091727.1 dihydroxyacetone kinase subunit L [Citrobacter freundii]
MGAIMLTKEYFISSFNHIAEAVEEQKYYLSQLDSDIGDGDHGINLSIGFREVHANLPDLANTTKNIGELLNKIGFILLSKVGGASGPLYGGFFIAMGKSANDKEQVSLSDFIDMLSAGVGSIAKRGKASAGDKTMLDSLLPGIEFLQKNVDQLPMDELFENMIAEMQKGSDAVIHLVAKKGRAMRLGERAIGHKDPGAESAILLLKSFRLSL